MTNEEKLKSILSHPSINNFELKEEHLAAMMITGYLGFLQDQKLIESEFSVTPTGKNLIAVCEEFDWKPADKDVDEFLLEYIQSPDERKAFKFLVLKVRDGKDKFLEELKKFRQEI